MPTTASTEVSEPSGRSVCISGSFGGQTGQRRQVATCRTARYRNEIAVAAEPVDVGARPRDRGLDVGDVRRPAMVRRHPVVHRQTHPAHARPGATSARSPAAAGCRAPMRRPARRSSPAPVRLAVPWAATRPATATGGRRSAPRCGARCGGAAGTSTPAGCAPVPATRSPGPRRPRRRAARLRVTALVASRSCRRSSALPGLNQDRALAPTNSGIWRYPQMPIAVAAPSGSRRFPIIGRDADATLIASM